MSANIFRPAYLIADEVIHNAAKFEEYRRLSAPSIAAYGSELLVRGGKINVFEGDWQPKRLVLIQFANTLRAQAWYDSPAYSHAKLLRQQAAITDMLIVQGE